MFKANLQRTEDPPQGSAFKAPNPIFDHLSVGGIKAPFHKGHDTPAIRRLGIDDAQTFLQMHSEVRTSLPDDQKKFMKELNPDLLNHLLEQNMPVIGVFVGDKMVSGCAMLYPSDEKVADYLADYDFEGQENDTAVISAVWTHQDHTGKGLSKMAIEQGMNFALFEGKEIFRAKVDKENAPSLGLFSTFQFKTKMEGPNPEKFYPILAL